MTDKLGEYSRFHIRVRAETHIGQIIGVGGSAYELGFFDRDKVVQLVTTPESYPVWYTQYPILLPKGQEVKYRYCIIEGGAVKAFENRSEARSFIPNDYDVILEDVLTPENLDTSVADSESDLLAEIDRLKGITTADPKFLDQIMSEFVKGRRLLIVCYHLPVSIARTNNPEAPFAIDWSESLIAKSSKGSVSGSMETYWVGTCKVPGAAPTEAEMNYLLGKLKEMFCVPIFLEAAVAQDAYNGYCKQVRIEGSVLTDLVLVSCCRCFS
jgi:trehalose 6-phosphate synthase/phosphatase